MCLEASSQGLDQYRLDGIEFSVAAFTNLTSDHIEYHSNIENYYAAKMRLFRELLCGTAVINKDDEKFEDIAHHVNKLISYGSSCGDVHLKNCQINTDHMLITLDILGSTYQRPVNGPCAKKLAL